jgi:hypothetical protein
VQANFHPVVVVELANSLFPLVPPAPNLERYTALNTCFKQAEKSNAADGVIAPILAIPEIGNATSTEYNSDYDHVKLHWLLK